MDNISTLYIEPTSRCNLSCSMCFRNSWIAEPFADMSMDVFNAIIRGMPPSVETVFFGGMGEPLFHKNILEMVSLAAEHGKQVAMITNATLLDREMSTRLLDAGLSTLWISMDSFDAEKYNAIRKNSDFALVQKNIRTFNQERATSSMPCRLGINFVVMKSTVHQLTNIPHFASRFRVDEVNISNIIPADAASEAEVLFDKVIDWNMGSPDAQGTVIRLPMMNWRQEGVMEGVKDILSSASVVVSIAGHPLVRKTNYCRFIAEGTTFVRHDGNVSPCMALLHSASTYWNGRKRIVLHHSFGNVTSDTVQHIWNSAEYTAFRERAQKFDFSPCIRCSGCDLSETNEEDCFGNKKPTCGACLWAEGIISCP